MTHLTTHSRQFGIFRLNIQLIHDDPELVMLIMSKCIVVRCEMLYAEEVLQYVAISPEFSAVPDGDKFPEYEVIITEPAFYDDPENFTRTVEFKKR